MQVKDQRKETKERHELEICSCMCLFSFQLRVFEKIVEEGEDACCIARRMSRTRMEESATKRSHTM